MNEIIREVRKTDRKKCIEIILTNLREVNSKNYSSKFIKYLVKSYSKNFMKRSGIYTIIIEKEGEIIGTGSLSDLGQIRDVFIMVSNHRKGFGTKLMKNLEIEAKRKKMDKLFLYSAISAEIFYQNLGYINIDQLDHGEGNIEIRMEKSIGLE
ncbi:MAG: GNAT family N-acetyltransferase [Candidatus Hermodarchaeota archaeon]